MQVDEVTIERLQSNEPDNPPIEQARMIAEPIEYGKPCRLGEVITPTVEIAERLEMVR
jgi:hypothetical protein